MASRSPQKLIQRVFDRHLARNRRIPIRRFATTSTRSWEDVNLAQRNTKNNFPDSTAGIRQSNTSPGFDHGTARSRLPENPNNTSQRPSEESKQYIPQPTQSFVASSRSRKQSTLFDSDESLSNSIGAFLDGGPISFSPVLIRDLCTCPSCLDASTKQKLFSTADIPPNIKTRAVAQDATAMSFMWENDISGYGEDHATVIDIDVLRSISENAGAPSAGDVSEPGKQTAWDAAQYRQLQDLDYDAYVQDESTLFRALQQLHTHGLVFLRNVPEDAKSVSTIAERIGPVKNTFYGYTWDVRSVTEAKNVAYTSQDLGFHMDLLYMTQPPHLQFLHCIRSSAAGGASLFADSYKAAADLFAEDIEAFSELATSPASFHYNHPSSHLYHQDHLIIKLRRVDLRFASFLEMARLYRSLMRGERDSAEHRRAAETIRAFRSRERKIEEYIDNVSWAPPFQAPLRVPSWRGKDRGPLAVETLNRKVARWHRAAASFSKLIHRESGMYERMMKPGECVLFDNRRVLHARRAFAVGDAGKERWLRGAYLDWDPYWSKMRVLGRKFGQNQEDGDLVSS